MPKGERRGRPWEPEDDAQLAKYVDRFGPKWPQISKLIRRSENATRNHWHDYVKPKARRLARVTAPPGSRPPGPPPGMRPRTLTGVAGPVTDRPPMDPSGPDEPRITNYGESLVVQIGGPLDPSEPVGGSAPAEAGPYPSDHQLFEVLKNSPKSLTELSRLFDRSTDTIAKRLDTLQVEGWYLVRDEDQFSVPTSLRPQIIPEVSTLADVKGRDIRIAIGSDLHAGSAWSQPTAYDRFRRIAYEEYGCRVFLSPGDTHAGIYGYKGQDQDLIPACRPVSRDSSASATMNQVWLANKYTRPMEGAVTYILGGNHDWFHVTANGHDPVRILCSQRDDMIYCGYDMVTLPLTEDANVRMWHPSGGMPYARSYRLQKGLESQAYADLRAAIAKNRTPKVSALIAGHLHMAIVVPLLPIIGVHPGCFEGQSNYLKRKGLTPDIGGTILTFRLTDAGQIQRVGWDFFPFDEIENDWKNWPVPPEQSNPFESDEVRVLFSFHEKPAAPPAETATAPECVTVGGTRVPGESGPEYVGGR